MSRWRDVVRIHRLEYPFTIHYLCHAVLGVSYAASDLQQLLTSPVLLVIIANLLAIVAGNPLNTAADIATDSHTQGKGDVASAVLRLGRQQAIHWAAVEITLALLLATILSLWLDRVLIVASVALTVTLCLLYNLEPVRLKRRGFANPITIGLCLGLLPSLAGYSAVRPDLDRSAWLIFVGYGTLITARALWWMIPDRVGDGATGILTPAVQYGVFRTLSVACALTVVGLGLFCVGLMWRYGSALALVGGIVIAAFFVNKLALLCRVSDDRLPSSQQLRRRSLAPATIADVFLVLLPLASVGI
ncbi:MAG: UbiA prenyltransferase family protein [Gammaproteobacteria bacterium]